jgi:hypothetical protein
MSRPSVHISPIHVLLTVALSFSSLSAQSPAPSSADARLQALYTEEWNWRQQRATATNDDFYCVNEQNKASLIMLVEEESSRRSWGRRPPHH